MYYQANAVDVALRKESVDRNGGLMSVVRFASVALRKESVDRNYSACPKKIGRLLSLSARRAWIEILCLRLMFWLFPSLSARRAWIEIGTAWVQEFPKLVALRKESVDRN